MARTDLTATLKAYDLLIQGEGGIIATTGYPDKPARAGLAIADIAAGMYSALGILLALYQREKTGQGQFIDVSMLDSIGVLARLFSTSLLACRRRAGAGGNASPLCNTLRSVPRR